MLEMEHLLNRKPAELSGGQRQRVAIGRAIVKDPKLFMFDEPLSNLDAALRSRTRQEIANLHRRIRTAMLFVTHDQTEAMTLADRIVLMNKQKIEQVGTPHEIYTSPATIFAATFVGSPAMNILPVTLAQPGTGAARVAHAGRRHHSRYPDCQVGAIPAQAPMRMGLRPESVKVCARGDGHTEAKVELVEFLGDRTHVFLQLADGVRVVALDGPTTIAREAETVGVKLVAPRHVCLSLKAETSGSRVDDGGAGNPCRGKRAADFARRLARGGR